LQTDESGIESHWAEGIAADSKLFVEKQKKSLGFKAKGKSIKGVNIHYQLMEEIVKLGNTTLQRSEPITRTDVGTTISYLWGYIA